MIDRDYCGVYSLTCDICGSEADETFFEFYDAVEYKKQNGWRSQKHRGESVKVIKRTSKGGD